MKMIWRGITAAMLFFAIGAPGWARTEEETWDRCLRLDKVGPLEPDEIIEACRIVLKMDFIPPNVRNDAFNNIGAAYMRLGKTSEGIAAFSEALRKLREMPDVAEVRQLGNYTRRNRARAYFSVKQYGDALRDYDVMANNEAKYHSLRCVAYALYADDFASALPSCQKAIEADKDAGDAYTGWFVVEYRQGKYADVKADCDLAKQKTFLSLEATYVCVLADIRLGNDSKKREALREGLGLMEHGERFNELGMLP
jgi:tetratricopeptide (TPR) repeat protein